MITRRGFLRATAAAVGGAVGVGLYTWRIEPHWVEFVERPLPVKNLPATLRGARLVHLSDLHIGPQVSDDYLRKTFERVQQLEPEFVVYTGDFISYEADDLSHARQMFAHLPHGTRGTFGTLGNHDYGPGWAHPEIAVQIATLAGAAGVNILRNDLLEVDGLQIVGLDDLWGGAFDPWPALSQLDPQAPSILLSHNPDTADLHSLANYSGWILAGHTHGGQCKPPFLPPPLLPVRNKRYTCGEFALADDRRMYINRGVGHLLQVRFNVRPEVAVFTLEPA